MFNKENKKCTYERIIKDEKDIEQPEIYFTFEVLNHFKAYADLCDKEIGWLALVKNEGDKYLVYDTILPKQKVTSTTTDLNEDSLNDIAFELMKTRPDDFDKVKCWCHSHVNMTVFASGTDDATFEQFYSNCDYFIRVIVNKKGDMKVDFVDTNKEIRFNDIDWKIGFDSSDTDLNTIQAELDKLDVYYNRLSEQLEKLKVDRYNEVKARLEPIVKDNVSNTSVITYNKSKYPSYYNYSGWEDEYYGYNSGYEDLYKKEEEKEEEKKNIVVEERNIYDYDEDYEESFEMLGVYLDSKIIDGDDLIKIMSYDSEMSNMYAKEFGVDKLSLSAAASDLYEYLYYEEKEGIK